VNVKNQQKPSDAEWQAIEDLVVVDEAGNVIVSGSEVTRQAPGVDQARLYRAIKDNVTDGYEDDEWSVDWASVRRHYEALTPTRTPRDRAGRASRR
jgi:hypothetical protein